MDLVAPRAIDDLWHAGAVSSDPSVNVAIEANAQLLEAVFEELFGDYNLCRNVLLGSSASGGSWFYDAYFLATRGDRYPAYMDLGCGSSGINSSWTAFPFYANLLSFNTDANILARTKLHYSIGTADFLYPEAQEAIPHLQSLGFDVTTISVPASRIVPMTLIRRRFVGGPSCATTASFRLPAERRPAMCDPSHAAPTRQSLRPAPTSTSPST